MNGYFIRSRNGLVGKACPSLDDARKAAQGYLIDRSAERLCEVVPIVPNTIGGIGPPVGKATRNRRGGPIRWSEIPVVD